VTDYDAIVYDLDGTLVRLDVDWDAVRSRGAAMFNARNLDPAGDDLWTMLERASDHGFRDHLHDTIAEFEREGARSADRLALADDLPQTVPVGVCSLNAEAACQIALELHGLDPHVDALVGRDTVEHVKPHPQPLLEAVDRIGARPESTLFVGDSDSDAEAARRAGTAFQSVRDRLAGR
jgi:phosphoglycolate phosphatase